MTLTELKEYIANSPEKKWLQDYQFQVTFPAINYKATLKGVVVIYQFIIDQIEGYSKYMDLPPELAKVKQKFINAQQNILGLLFRKDFSEVIWEEYLRSLFTHNKSEPVFLCESSETIFLINTFIQRKDWYAGAYAYLIGSTPRPTDRNLLSGYILGYEFASKGLLNLTERDKYTHESISAILENLQGKIGEAQSHSVEYLSKLNQQSQDYVKKIDSLKSEKEGAFNNWFEKSVTDFTSFDKELKRKIEEYENLYRDKLKLEAPAKYWNDRATKLRKEGNRWLVGLIVCLVLAIIILVCVLNMTANGTLQKIFSETSAAIKWSVALITLISFLAYALRTFSKLTFSSFHLVRDAEEREQLTYVYLALQKDKGVDQTERHLIMQSLFSRADSGLLKDDSGPTMPGNIIDQVTKR